MRLNKFPIITSFLVIILFVFSYKQIFFSWNMLMLSRNISNKENCRNIEYIEILYRDILKKNTQRNKEFILYLSHELIRIYKNSNESYDKKRLVSICRDFNKIFPDNIYLKWILGKREKKIERIDQLSFIILADKRFKKYY